MAFEGTWSALRYLGRLSEELISQDLRSLRKIWGGGSSPSSDTLPVGRGTGGPLPRDDPGGEEAKGQRRSDRQRDLGLFLKVSYGFGDFSLNQKTGYAWSKKKFCFLTVQPRNEEVNDKCSLLEREDWKTRARVLLGEPWAWITLLQNYPFFVFRDPPGNCFSKFLLCLLSVGVEIVLERPVIMKEQEEGGNSLEVVVAVSSWSVPVRHDFIYFEVVASNLILGGKDWL